MDKKYLYMAEFTDGYPFKAVIDFLRSMIDEAKIVFTENKMILKEETSRRTVFIDIEINTNDIGNYEYRSKNKEEYFGFMLSHIKTSTANFGKKDSFRIWKSLDENTVAIQKLSNKNNLSSTRAANCNYIKCKETGPFEIYDLPVYENKPNCIVRSSEFSEICKSMTSTKCTNVTVIGFPYGIILEAQTGNEISSVRSRLGDCKTKQGEESKFDPEKIDDNDVDYDNSNVIQKINISSGTIKSLSKINNFVSGGNSTVQFFIKKDMPLCIISKIGNYGTVKVYLRDVSSSELY